MTPLPHRMEALNLDDVGRPIPWFTWVDPSTGKPDFRVMDATRMRRAIQHRLCWVCGQHLGAYLTTVAGPMCGVNRISAEPPSHTECATWSAENCPFLVNPNKLRRDKNLIAKGGAGVMVERNPGVSMLWTSKVSERFRSHAGGDGVLFRLGPPTAVRWLREGRPATRAEVLESMAGGIALFRETNAEQARTMQLGDTWLAKANAVLDGEIADLEPWLPDE
jgi:hypothetical protein